MSTPPSQSEEQDLEAGPGPDDCTSSGARHVWSRFLMDTVKMAYHPMDADSIVEGFISRDRVSTLPKHVPVNSNLVSCPRVRLLEWLSDVVFEYKMELGCIFVAMEILDLLSSRMFIKLTDYQQYGIVSLYIADKFVSVEPVKLEAYHLLIPAQMQFDFPKYERTILQTIDYKIPPSTLLSYFPLPFNYNMPTKTSYSLLTQFQQLCHYLAFICVEDFYLLNNYTNEDLSFCIYVLAAEFHFDYTAYIDVSKLCISHRTIYERLVSLEALFRLKSIPHPVTLHYNASNNLFYEQLKSK